MGGVAERSNSYGLLRHISILTSSFWPSPGASCISCSSDLRSPIGADISEPLNVVGFDLRRLNKSIRSDEEDVDAEDEDRDDDWF